MDKVCNNGRPFLLVNIETGDCERFNNVKELLIKTGYKCSIGESLKTALKRENIKLKYIFFAYEDNILSW